MAPMDIKLRKKYQVYNGDGPERPEPRPMTQYGMGRKGNGNGKRPTFLKVPEAFRAHSAAESRAAAVKPKVMTVNALTGHRVMVDG
jgi:hypothetical protein